VTHVITQQCCNDAACIPACPVNCIHPAPGEPDYGIAEMLYIDPGGCIDCGACIDVCPVGAIAPDYELPDELQRYVEINARWYADPAHQGYDTEPASRPARALPADLPPLRVAIVGSGPAACYAAEELLGQRGVEVSVDMLERLPVPYGLVRYGVAPDHQDTKAAASAFAKTMRRDRFRFFGNVEVGRDISLDALRERYHAVLLAYGASGARSLGLPGEELPGVVSATDVVAWYNGHPDAADIPLTGGRVVVIGNGNVAVDIARVLAGDPGSLARTDVSPRTLAALREHPVTDVTLVGRRGPAQAAFTTPELLGLWAADDLGLVVDPVELELQDTSLAATDPAVSMAAYKVEVLREIAKTTPPGGRRVTLRFQLNPVELLGAERVEGVRFERTALVETDGRVEAVGTGETLDLPADLVVTSVGYRGTAIDGAPFDTRSGTVPNAAGRVADRAGLYVAGWLKRGPSGVIGTNKACARETVDGLFADHAQGLLEQRVDEDVTSLLGQHVDLAGWRAIDESERAAGKARSASREKIVDIREMLRVANVGVL
jgi:ferredoxin--NADP+ reductase